MYHIFFIHSSVERHLNCFHVLAIVNSAAMNIGVCVSFRIMVFSGYTPRSGIAGSHRSMEQDGKSIDKPTYLLLPNVWQRRQEYTMEKRQSLQ